MPNFNPQIFINPPYNDCPMCKREDVFGVLAIGGNAYTRKCVVCKHTKRYFLPRLNKKIIYLDQFVLSNIAKSLHPDTRDKVKDPFWKELYGKLDTLCKLQAIICPKSNFHEEESRMTTKHFEKIRRINLQLSNGVSFVREEEIKKMQILKYVDCWVNPEVKVESLQLNQLSVYKKDPHSWQSRLIVDVDLPLTPLWSEGLRQIRQDAGRDFNEIVMKRHWEEQKDKTPKYFFRQVAAEEANAFGKVTLKLAKDQIKVMAAVSLGIIPADFTNFYPNPSFRLVEAIKELFIEKGISEDKVAEQVCEFLSSPLLAELPFNKISGALHAAAARKHCAGRSSQPSAKNPSILSDISMISTLLPYCDAMMIDTECYLYLKEPDVQQYLDYETRLFSPKNRNEFLNYLDEIEASLKSEHCRKVESLFGKDWAKPYYNIFAK